MINGWQPPKNFTHSSLEDSSVALSVYRMRNEGTLTVSPIFRSAHFLKPGKGIPSWQVAVKDRLMSSWWSQTESSTLDLMFCGETQHTLNTSRDSKKKTKQKQLLSTLLIYIIHTIPSFISRTVVVVLQISDRGGGIICHIKLYSNDQNEHSACAHPLWQASVCHNSSTDCVSAGEPR